ncbi:hypothetical protein E2C01_036189 [Portunus trituberculatus]|uniref:Uncharacterized protein n=1 Tax=Portunus trituberculatus TaxID=210409 RepID=A0A5B7FAJ8_PORTR|nr:hypothetical protein [Portunus trituberculatus]
MKVRESVGVGLLRNLFSFKSSSGLSSTHLDTMNPIACSTASIAKGVYGTGSVCCSSGNKDQPDTLDTFCWRLTRLMDELRELGHIGGHIGRGEGLYSDAGASVLPCHGLGEVVNKCLWIIQFRLQKSFNLNANTPF